MEGPYEVQEKLRKGRCRLKTTKGEVLKKLYNGALLKDYKEPLDGGPVSIAPLISKLS